MRDNLNRVNQKVKGFIFPVMVVVMKEILLTVYPKEMVNLFTVTATVVKGW
jgi:hypothetical protein